MQVASGQRERHRSKLSAYYEVSVVLLEPEDTQSRAGRVLAYGVTPLIEGAPRIDSSENTLSFTIPGDPDVREVILRPAQVRWAVGSPSLDLGLVVIAHRCS